MEWIVKLGQLILSLSILIVLHELGHFIPARLFGTRVEKFMLFFDYKFAIFKKRFGETEWGLGWIPFGGYVKISGMIDESMDKEQMAKPAEPWEYRSKPAWQRLIIILGGVFVNVILAIVIYILISFVYGDRYLPNKSLVDGIWVQNEDAAQAIGLQNGDKILTINGIEQERFAEITANLIYAGGGQMEIERNGEVLSLPIPVDIDQIILRSDVPIIFSYRLPFFVGGFSPDITHAQDAGLKVRDQITGVNGVDIKYFDEFSQMVKNNKGNTIDINVLRDEQPLTLNVQVSEEGFVGISPIAMSLIDLDRLGYYEIETINYTFFEAIPAGLTLTKNTLQGYVQQFKLIFTKEGIKHVGSIGTFMSLFPSKWDWEAFWRLSAFLSLILAFMNVLPIPALDGGHAAFITYEIITGKKPSDKFLEKAQTVGMVLLLTLMVYALGNDIFKGLTGKLFK
jgi:regulator of sigma E protease